MILTMEATGAPADLLASDSGQALMRLADHPVWRSALSGEISKGRLKKLVLTYYPAVAGLGRYIFSAKISQIDRDDGEVLFRDLYDQNQNPAADADKGWQEFGAALDISKAEFQETVAKPTGLVSDYVAIVREHGLRSSAAESAAVGWALERQLPALWGAFADSLVKNYGVPESAVTFLRYQAKQQVEVEKWTDYLVEKYLAPAEPYNVFEARRAAREVVWAWTALAESV